MATITIDDVQYELDDLSDEAKAQLESLHSGRGPNSEGE